MAIDTAQKRMSAIACSCPWRGPLVDATESGFGQGNRAAAVWLYSGIVTAIPSPPGTPTMEFALHGHMHYSLHDERTHYALSGERMHYEIEET